MKISFVGDIGLHNGYEKSDYDKEALKSFLQQFNNSDIVIGNLETFVRSDYQNPLKSPILETSSKAYDILRGHNLILATANNHLYDTGLKGFNNTLNSIQRLGLSTFGSAFDDKGNLVFKNCINDTEIIILNYVHPDTGIKTPPECELQIPIYNKEMIVNKIKEHKKQDNIVLLYLHWGGDMDYGNYPSEYQYKDAKEFANAGVNAVIGTHNHSIQPIEYIKAVPIAYGLGHFLFDDFYFRSKKISLRKSGKKGIGVHLNFDGNEFKSLESFGFEIKKLVPKTSIKVLKELKTINFKFKFYKKVKLIRVAYKLYLKKIEPKIFYLELSDKSIFEKLKSVNFKKLKQLFKS